MLDEEDEEDAVLPRPPDPPGYEGTSSGVGGNWLVYPCPCPP